jgi:hypothetical protein
MLRERVRRANLLESNAFAKHHARLSGTWHESTWGAHVYRRFVPHTVEGAAMRLRLWAANVHDGVRT